MPPIPANSGRAQPTPRINRSLAAELTGALTSLFDITSIPFPCVSGAAAGTEPYQNICNTKRHE